MGIVDFMKRLSLSGEHLVDHRDQAGARMSSINWSTRRAPLTDDDRVLVSETHLWLRSIPRAFHPRRLCLDYPRTANRLARSWHDPELVDQLLKDLLTDKRGGRVGFPPRIVGELKLLRHFHEEPHDAWLYVAATVRRPQRRPASPRAVAGP